MQASFCRDCFALAPAPAPRRCGVCGSPRLASHPELDRLTIAHIDCDAFYAAVEKRDNPALRDRPVIIGGGKRGVVATACYIARTFGVRSAMPMFKALQACPQAAVVKPDMAKYVRVGREVRALMGELTPLVQPVSIDEAFLDLAGTQALHGAIPAMVLARFAGRVERELGITVSVGLSDCKFLAKLASDLDKPRGLSIIGRAEAASFLRPLPVGAISGIGAVSAKKLASQGFRTIGDIQDCDEKSFARRSGTQDLGLWRLARGIDARPVSPERETKSISAETTFAADLASAEDLLPVLYGLCEKVSFRLTQSGFAASGVVLKLKTGDFKLKTRSRSQLAPTQLAVRLFEEARSLLQPELDGTPYRLIGLGAASLHPGSDADQGDLVDTTLARQKAAAQAIDAVRNRFGGKALVRGISLTGRTNRD
jgi:DNA polymerase-4